MGIKRASGSLLVTARAIAAPPSLNITRDRTALAYLSEICAVDDESGSGGLAAQICSTGIFRLATLCCRSKIDSLLYPHQRPRTSAQGRGRGRSPGAKIRLECFCVSRQPTYQPRGALDGDEVIIDTLKVTPNRYPILELSPHQVRRTKFYRLLTLATSHTTSALSAYSR